MWEKESLPLCPNGNHGVHTAVNHRNHQANGTKEIIRLDDYKFLGDQELISGLILEAAHSISHGSKPYSDFTQPQIRLEGVKKTHLAQRETKLPKKGYMIWSVMALRTVGFCQIINQPRIYSWSLLLNWMINKCQVLNSPFTRCMCTCVCTNVYVHIHVCVSLWGSWGPLFGHRHSKASSREHPTFRTLSPVTLKSALMGHGCSCAHVYTCRPETHLSCYPSCLSLAGNAPLKLRWLSSKQQG